MHEQLCMRKFRHLLLDTGPSLPVRLAWIVGFPEPPKALTGVGGR